MGSSLTSDVLKRSNQMERPQEYRMERPVSTQHSSDHLQADETGLRQNQSCRHLDLQLPASKTMRKQMSVFVFKIYRLWYCVMAAQQANMQAIDGHGHQQDRHTHNATAHTFARAANLWNPMADSCQLHQVSWVKSLFSRKFFKDLLSFMMTM